jgi:hypothetical protein
VSHPISQGTGTPPRDENRRHGTDEAALDEIIGRLLGIVAKVTEAVRSGAWPQRTNLWRERTNPGR